MELAKRAHVPVELTWDLSGLYPDGAALAADMAALRTMTQELEARYRGKLDSVEAVMACLDRLRALLELADRAGSYCALAAAVDYGDSALQEQESAMGRLAGWVNSRLSFIDSELSDGDEDLLRRAAAQGGPNRPYLERLLRAKPHRLHPEAERALAALGPVLETPYQVYSMAKLADMRFPPFRAEGEEFPLSYALYEEDYAYDGRTPVRRAAFSAFSRTLREYENVTACAYQAQVQREKVMADLRDFPSVFDSLLFGQRVDRELYDRQIDLGMARLAPHMRRYARLLKEIHGLDRMTYADLKLTVDPGFDPQVSVAQSEEYIVRGLSVLGEDYVQMVRTAYRERWADFAQNRGKATGGFCSTPYGGHAYILLNWSGRMSDVFTLAHELGHAGHFAACGAAQSVFGVDVSTYFVEAPSTMNELLMAHYLLKTNPDRRFRRWVLGCMVGNTYYHNFVTHLLEAAFQREVYRLVDAGGGVQAQALSGLMRDTLARFWGEEVELTPGAELTWMRQPHYYMGLYSYTYSAGLTVAAQACKRIEAQGAPAVADWRRMLAAGGTKPPLELAKMAGVDISTDAALLDTIDTVGGYIDELSRLTRELA